MLDNLEVKIKYTHAGSDYGSKCHFNDLPPPSSVTTEGKRLFLFRDPRDTVVSAYFQKSKRKKDNSDCGEISDFIRDPRFGIEKIILFNLSWLEHEDLAALKTYKSISYEALRQDPVSGLTAIYTYFKGHGPRKKRLIEDVVEEASFARMQAKERSGELAERYGSILRPGNFNDPESYKVRRGKVGGYADYLKDDDIAYCEQIMLRHQYSLRLSEMSRIMLVQA